MPKNEFELQLTAQSESDVFVVNNAGMFALYSLLRNTHHSPNKTFILIYPGYWLDTTHEQYNNLAWGLTPYSLPPDTLHLFRQLFPQHEGMRFMNWYQIKKLRAEVLQIIRQHHQVRYFEGKPEWASDLNRYQINIHGEKKASITFDKKPTIYSWVRIPKVNNIEDHLSTPIVKLYQMPSEQIPAHICILGSGLSVNWVVRDFAQSRLTSFHLEQDSLIKIPATEEIDTSRLRRIVMNNSEIFSYGNQSNLISYRGTNLTFECPLFTAIGYVLHPYLSNSILNQSSTCTWVAPQNSPSGSLIFSYTLIAHQLGKFSEWLGHPWHYCENYFIPEFKQRMQELGIFIPEQFFQHLRRYISLKHNASSLDDSAVLYEEAFNATNLNPLLYTRFSQYLRRKNINQSPVSVDLTNRIISIRHYFESLLAHSLLSSTDELSSTITKMSNIVCQQMQRYKEKVMALIEANPSFQSTIYSNEKFAAPHPEVDFCLPAESLFLEFIHMLNNGSITEKIHLICMFAFRIFPHLQDFEYSAQRFLYHINAFNNNATFRNDKLRVARKNPMLPRFKTHFGLVKHAELPNIKPHVYCHGFFRSQDSLYNEMLQRLRVGYITGPSGHASRVLSMGMAFNFNNEELTELAVGLFAYLAGGGNHNFHEIFIAAQSMGIFYDPGTYSALPARMTNSTAYQDIEDKLKIELGSLLTTHHELREEIESIFGLNRIVDTYDHRQMESFTRFTWLSQFVLTSFWKNFVLECVDQYLLALFKMKDVSEKWIIPSILFVNSSLYCLLYGVESVFIYLVAQTLAHHKCISQKNIHFFATTIIMALSLSSEDWSLSFTLLAMSSYLSTAAGRRTGEYTANRFFSKNNKPRLEEHGIAFEANKASIH